MDLSKSDDPKIDFPEKKTTGTENGVTMLPESQTALQLVNTVGNSLTAVKSAAEMASDLIPAVQKTTGLLGQAKNSIGGALIDSASTIIRDTPLLLADTKNSQNFQEACLVEALRLRQIADILRSQSSAPEDKELAILREKTTLRLFEIYNKRMSTAYFQKNFRESVSTSNPINFPVEHKLDSGG